MTLKKANQRKNLGDTTELRDENKKLKEILMQLKKQLMSSNRLASLGEISAGIAHELNQPLAIIRARTELLRMRSREEDLSMDELTDELSEILKRVDKAVLLIEQMRGFSRKDDGFVEHIDITEPVDRALLFFREQFRAHKIEFEVCIAESLPRVKANPQNIEQMVINFLTNARHAVEKRHSTRGDSPMKVKLELKLGDKEKYIVLQVSDNGAGMTPVEKENCLDAFFTTKVKGEGTGLGLSIVHGIIKDLDGILDIDSEVGVGTTMSVKIPVV